jgi:uncharacterized protein YtpQ (UPF0354 family)
VHPNRTTFLPVIVSVDDPQYGDDYLLDEFLDDLAVAYAIGPPYGERLVTWTDLDQTGWSGRAVRRMARDNLDAMLDQVRIHGQPPALMLSFDGLESSVLLADEFWQNVERHVPGELVIGVPARDVVIITGSQSRPGLEKAQRGVDRVFFAGDRHPVSRELLVWRHRQWMVFQGPAPPPPQQYRPPVPQPRQAQPRQAQPQYPRQVQPPRQAQPQRPSGPPRMRRASGPAR